MLVSYGDLIRCGLRKGDIPRLIQSGQLTFLRYVPNSRRRYRKQDVEKILGLI